MQSPFVLEYLKRTKHLKKTKEATIVALTATLAKTEEVLIKKTNELFGIQNTSSSSKLASQNMKVRKMPCERRKTLPISFVELNRRKMHFESRGLRVTATELLNSLEMELHGKLDNNRNEHMSNKDAVRRSKSINKLNYGSEYQRDEPNRMLMATAEEQVRSRSLKNKIHNKYNAYSGSNGTRPTYSKKILDTDDTVELSRHRAGANKKLAEKKNEYATQCYPSTKTFKETKNLIYHNSEEAQSTSNSQQANMKFRKPVKQLNANHNSTKGFQEPRYKAQRWAHSKEFTNSFSEKPWHEERINCMEPSQNESQDSKKTILDKYLFQTDGHRNNERIDTLLRQQQNTSFPKTSIQTNRKLYEENDYRTCEIKAPNFAKCTNRGSQFTDYNNPFTKRPKLYTSQLQKKYSLINAARQSRDERKMFISRSKNSSCCSMSSHKSRSEFGESESRTRSISSQSRMPYMPLRNSSLEIPSENASLKTIYKRYDSTRCEDSSVENLIELLSSDTLTEMWHKSDIIETICTRQGSYRLAGGLWEEHSQNNISTPDYSRDIKNDNASCLQSEGRTKAQRLEETGQRLLQLREFQRLVNANFERKQRSINPRKFSPIKLHEVKSKKHACPINGAHCSPMLQEELFAHFIRYHLREPGIELREIFEKDRLLLVFNPKAFSFGQNFCISLLAYGGMHGSTSLKPVSKYTPVLHTKLPQVVNILNGHLPLIVLICRTTREVVEGKRKVHFEDEPDEAGEEYQNDGDVLILWVVSLELASPLYVMITVFSKSMMAVRSNVIEVRSITNSQEIVEFIRKDKNYLYIDDSNLTLLSNFGEEPLYLELMLREYGNPD